MSAVDVVLIGRNEGDRLVNALASLAGQARQIVYVDSGSTDGSLAAASAAGAKVVALDMSVPFTAARARNAGFDALDDPEFVQFIDGDCRVVEGYIEKAAQHLAADASLGVVTGWRSEIYPDLTPYNRLCEWEWRRPPGEIVACGGDMMVRAEAFRKIGGFNADVIAAEDDEFCIRMRAAGWRLERIPEEMTRHDADMTRFSQWWKRAERTGHGFAQVGQMHPGYFSGARRRVLFYGLALPVFAWLWLPWTLLLALALYAVSTVRSMRVLQKDGVEQGAAFLGLLFTLSKFPNLLGMARFYLRRARKAPMRIIEYK